MISDLELWACANQMLGHHGDGVDAFIAERVAALAATRDRGGVQTWVAMAERADLMRDEKGAVRVRH